MRSQQKRWVWSTLNAVVLCVFMGCSGMTGHLHVSNKKPAEKPPTALDMSPYQPVIDQIVEAAMASNGSWEKMEGLCDDIGHRLSGSPQLDQAIAWAVEAMKKDGHENVHTEPVQVPKWVRGKESLAMIAPRAMTLPMLGLGRSVATPSEGISAEVEVVEDEAGLDALGAAAQGKIVLFNNPMPAYDPVHGSGYGKTVRFRAHGARMASALGAVAVLVRSVTAHSLRTPHTGAMRYGDAKVKIPAAAITVEDAEMIARLRKKGVPVRVRLQMEAHDEGWVPSANVIGELVGREKPEEVVVIGGHLDSWDVGQGAHDDATGVVMAMEAISVLRRLNVRPRRTIRVVLWTNEENGLAGGKAYAKAHMSELAKHVAAIESDSGGFAPRGFRLDLANKKKQERALSQLASVVYALKAVSGSETKVGFSGADIWPMLKAGVPLLGLWVKGEKYFDYHHTAADTLDKVDPTELSQCVATMAAMAYVLAEMPGRLGDPPAK
jgi:carboxypeptidase Q